MPSPLKIRLVTSDEQRLRTFYQAAFSAPLSEVEFEEVPGAPMVETDSPDTAFQHFAIAVADIEAAWQRLCRTEGWTPISRNGPVQLPERSGGVIAVKFCDPEGHPLELIQFPDARAGMIDHTAIVVTSTARSVDFYTRLGFRSLGTQLNHGTEQAALDGLPDPQVEVTPLIREGVAGPGIELLCYRRPLASCTTLADDALPATRIVLDADGAVHLDPDSHRIIIRQEIT